MGSCIDAERLQLRSTSTGLHERNAQLESDLAIARGGAQALARQVAGLTAENVQLKEEVAFFKELVADSNAGPGLSLPRLALDRQSDETWHYRLLVVRGGNPKDDFAGRVVLQATIASRAAADGSTRILTLPNDQPQTAAALTLAFRYYQRVEGSFHVPPGSRVTTLVARAFEGADGAPIASRTYTNALSNP